MNKIKPAYSFYLQQIIHIIYFMKVVSFKQYAL